ncbi:hypothetical protein A2U01_0051641, partial [Trifolium medium]|nr:hypothetical protein [Trifolium medium]
MGRRNGAWCEVAMLCLILEETEFAPGERNGAWGE